MKQLPTVTLFAVACTKVDETINALKKSMEGIKFAKVILITHEKIKLDEFGITVINIEKLDYKGYNHFVLFRIGQYIETDFALLIQNDGYILNPQKWNDVFFNYDYIGAPWAPLTHFTEEGKEVRIGNGGFSFRSKKLMDIFIEKDDLTFTDNNTGFFHEDGIISVYHRTKLENYGIRYAPIDIASKFSREGLYRDSVFSPFGFHNKRNIKPKVIIQLLLVKIGIRI